ncbi:MAG: radical SAM family heme chaperone HemW [Lentisphaeria bacterium]|jgi:oxygen-independent coproporphyrinogen-3 oxidase|nr:radical SAM family heme chaperone HemW [Lentisphaeria bacterium]
MAYESLYLHVPFCAAKCDYCAFYSEAGAAPARRRRYLDRLRAELAAASQPEPLASVFIGGGTPSLLEPAELDELLRLVTTHFQLAPAVEWTVECNPDSLDGAKIDRLARHGVNRVSLGVQSFRPELRAILGRRGSLGDLAATLARLRTAGIVRQNLDLIYAIPGQSLAVWREDLARVADLGVGHVSAYALTIEEGTRLAARLGAPDDASFEAMWDLADEVLGGAGIRRYEISNFARPGEECRHNLAIWHGGTYLGCGPAATSFDGRDRWTQPPALDDWLAGLPPERDELPPRDRACEILAFGFRTLVGWQWPAFRARTGYDAQALRGPELAELVRHGLLAPRGDGLAPTRAGLLLNDSLLAHLL